MLTFDEEISETCHMVAVELGKEHESYENHFIGAANNGVVWQAFIAKILSNFLRGGKSHAVTIDIPHNCK